MWGGWDAPFVFAPELLGKVDHEAEATASEAMGLPFVDHPDRSTVRDFFQTLWGPMRHPERDGGAQHHP